MATDRARITYDPTRQYREVVSQQGRVTLEADNNEGQRISTEEVRHHALDFVGPWGTPDDGYKVLPAGTDDLNIGAGTMYVGGLRLELPAQIKYSTQTEWLDTPIDPLWKTKDEVNQLAHGSAVLFVQEQEITAVEDPPLREVALGGPDSAGRTRMLQRIIIADTQATTCETAANDATAFWTKVGLVPNPKTAELASRARLRVSLVTTGTAASPCDPPAQSGYLGADNQMIRVQITEFNPATNRGRLVWGYNNASVLYRCRRLDATTIELATRPVSPEFAPRANQAVQLLLPSAELGTDAYAASLVGHVATLTTPYQADTKRVTFPAALPAAYQNASSSKPLYLRLWEQSAEFTLNTALELQGTGLAVTLSSVSSGALHAGDYWSFAARPTTRNAIYPERFLTAAQPPTGPRMWYCPLAVIGHGTSGLSVTDDCRLPFDNLPELTARKPGEHKDNCCCITLTPKDADKIQSVINKLKGKVNAVIKFEPGEYRLRHPIVLTSANKGLVLRGCTGYSTIFRPVSGDISAFALGFIIGINASNVTIEGITFAMPGASFDGDFGKFVKLQAEKEKAAVATAKARTKKASTPEVVAEETPLEYYARYERGFELNAVAGTKLAGKVAVGVHLFSCRNITIDLCTFGFRGEDGLFGAAVLMRGITRDVRVHRTTITGDGKDAASILNGVCVLPMIDPEGESRMLIPDIDGLDVSECRFSGLAYPTLVVATSRAIAVRDNVARDCYSSLMLWATDEQLDEVQGLDASMWGDNAAAVDDVNAFLMRQMRDARFRLAVRLSVLLWHKEFAKRVQDAKDGSVAELSLIVSGNDFDNRPDRQATNINESASSMVIWDTRARARSACTITGNIVQNRSTTGPTLMVLAAERFDVTGNVLTNDFPELKSGDGVGRPGQSRVALLVVPGGQEGSNRLKAKVNTFTVTGNTMGGMSNLRDWPRMEWENRLPKDLAGLLTWEFFNTET